MDQAEGRVDLGDGVLEGGGGGPGEPTSRERLLLLQFQDLSRLEGILPALESSHALAYARKMATRMKEGAILVVNLSGRGDKDLAGVLSYLGRGDR